MRQGRCAATCVVVLAVLAPLLAGCYASRERGAAGHVDAAPRDASSTDGGGRDAHPRPRPPVELLTGEMCGGLYGGHRPAPCDAAFERRCQRSMELSANGYYGHTRCEDHHLSTRCGNGDFCPPDGPCRCAESVDCPPAHVCVSDTPDGPRWCRLQCAP